MIYVCWADVSGLDESGLSRELSEYRREKLRLLKPPAARRAGIGAELLLQHALRRYRPELSLPPVICRGENGKPFLAGCDLFFSLSHSGDFAACALSDAEIGLDIQVPAEAGEGLVRRFLAPGEREYLAAAHDRDSAFSELWTRKESFVKATGKGLAAGLSSFCAVPGAELQNDGRCYTAYYERFPDFHLAVCYPAEEKQKIEIEKIELP